MESNKVDTQEPLLHDPTETSSMLKQEAAAESPGFHTGSKRPYCDSTFTVLFLTAILTTFTFGIIASTRTDALNMDTRLRLSHYNPTTNKCEITQQQTSDSTDPDSDSAYVTLVALASLFALALTIPFSLLLVSLLRRYTHTLIVPSATFVLLFPVGAFVLLLSRCLMVSKACVWLSEAENIFSWMFILFMSALFGYGLWENWTGSAVENGVSVLRMATGFWKEHFVLLVLNPVLLMGAMVVVNGPIFTFMWYAYNIGEIVPDFDAVNDPTMGCDLATGIRCCRAERPEWVHAYITFASFTAFWVLTVSMVLQHSVVSGTVSLWYFSPTGSSATGNIKRSLRNAYGPSFGMACNLGTIVTTVFVMCLRFFKKILSNKVLENHNQGMILSIFHRCFFWMSQYPKCYNYPQLSSIFLGIWESSKKSHQNLLQWTSPTSTAMTNFHDWAFETLKGMTLICTLLQTLVVYGVVDYFSNAHAGIKVLVGLYCFFVTIVGLGTGFFSAVSSVIESVSFCYALERDVGEISKPEVCQAFMVTAPLLPQN